MSPTAQHEVPEFPADRDERCPFDPAPALAGRPAPGRVRLWDGSTPWMLTGHAQQRALLADPRISADITADGYPRQAPLTSSANRIGFILMDDPEHNRLRRMVTGPFSVRRTEALRPRVEQIVDDLLEAMLAGPQPADLVQEFALPVPSLVICELLGVPYADHGFFQDSSAALIRRAAAPEERAAAGERLAGYLGELVDRKRTEPADDVLSGLADRVTAGELTGEEAAGLGVLLLVAGHETTANMIALGTLALLEHPEQLAALRDTDDPAVVAAAVEELLRYLSITHSGRRRVALADIEIDGVTIRAGEGVVLPNEVANRDPDAFPDPDRLDLARGSRRHVAFGFGVHQCLGQNLARMELQVAYPALLRRVPTLRAAAPLADIPFKHDGSVYGVYELPVTW